MLKKIHKMIIAAIAIILATGIGLASYLYITRPKKIEQAPTPKNLQQEAQQAEKITNEATKGVLPSIQTNPLENKPDVNPADKANPIKNIKTNPFE